MRDTNVYERMDMKPLDKVDGPAIINGAIGTNVMSLVASRVNK